jgi:conjugative transposon TraN protein
MWMKGFLNGVIYFLTVIAVRAQGANDSLAFVNGQVIEVSRTVTTNLLFHYRIKQVDRGSGALLAKLGNDTVLLLRAAQSNLPPTNLSVYTSDGKLHGFWVRYVEKPVHPWVRLQDSNEPVQRRTDTKTYTEDRLLSLCDSVWLSAMARHGSSNRQYRLRWLLRGIYTYPGLLFFPLELVNHSSMDYELERVRFIIRGKRRAKRVATQERELSPVFIQGDTTPVAAGERRRLVLVLPAFTASGKRELHITIEEKGGGRELFLDISSRKLTRAKILMND